MRGELGGIVADWRRSAQKARTYREELIPEARMSLDATFASYRVGRADFASLFQAELELLNFERTTLMAATDAAEALVSAEEIVGRGVK
jgi:outer membrane protein TolC